jgi:hypothetical protein
MGPLDRVRGSGACCASSEVRKFFDGCHLLVGKFECLVKRVFLPQV